MTPQMVRSTRPSPSPPRTPSRFDRLRQVPAGRAAVRLSAGARRFQVAADVLADEHGARSTSPLRALSSDSSCGPSTSSRPRAVPPFRCRRACWRGATSPVALPSRPRCRPPVSRRRVRCGPSLAVRAAHRLPTPVQQVLARSSRGMEPPGMTAGRAPPLPGGSPPFSDVRGGGRPPARAGQPPQDRPSARLLGPAGRAWPRDPDHPERTQQWLRESRADRVLVLTRTRPAGPHVDQARPRSPCVKRAGSTSVKEVQKFGRIDVILALSRNGSCPRVCPTSTTYSRGSSCTSGPGDLHRRPDGRGAAARPGRRPVAPLLAAAPTTPWRTSKRSASPTPSAPSWSRATWCW